MRLKDIADLLDLVESRAVVTATGAFSVSDAVRLMADKNIGVIIVMEGEAGTGVFTERDLMTRVIAAGADPDSTALADVMTHNPRCVTLDDDFGEVLRVMMDNGFRHLPVLDKQDQDGHRPLIGMLSACDFLKVLGERLDAVVTGSWAP